MSSLSVGDLLHPQRGPLTAEEIAVIEEEMDQLLVDMFINNEELFGGDYEALEHDLQSDLLYKMRGYLAIVTQIEKNGADEPELEPEMRIDPRFGENLRSLIVRVEDYYYGLN